MSLVTLKMSVKILLLKKIIRPLFQWRNYGFDFLHFVIFQVQYIRYCWKHRLRTPNEGINQRYLKNWAEVAGKICFGRT